MKLNKVLKMDYKGQTAVLSSIFVLVGMIFLVPAITEKALAGVNAVATISGCEKYTQDPCKFTVGGFDQYGKRVQFGLDSGKWVFPGGEPRVSWTCWGPDWCGDTVKWQTTRNPPPGNEKGFVNLEGAGGARGSVQLFFDNPVLGKNSCGITRITFPGSSPTTNFDATCEAGSGQNADFTYTFKVYKAP